MTDSTFLFPQIQILKPRCPMGWYQEVGLRGLGWARSRGWDPMMGLVPSEAGPKS